MTLPPSFSTRVPAADAEPPGNVVSILPQETWDERTALTSRNDVIDNQHLLPRLDRVGLHLEKIRAILLHVLGSLAGTWELTPLTDRHEGRAEPQGQGGAEEEAAGIQANDDIGLLGEGLLDVQLEGVDERLEQGGVGEDGQDVLEQDARLREVGELAQGGAEVYFKTGEFGGTGGIGGGESSLGAMARVGGGIGLLGGRVRGSGGAVGVLGGGSGVVGVAVSRVLSVGDGSTTHIEGLEGGKICGWGMGFRDWMLGGQRQVRGAWAERIDSFGCRLFDMLQ